MLQILIDNPESVCYRISFWYGLNFFIFLSSGQHLTAFNKYYMVSI